MTSEKVGDEDGSEKIPSNVDNCAAAYKATASRSRSWFNTVDGGAEDTSKTNMVIKKFVCAHSALGGAPGLGDWNATLMLNVEFSESKKVDEFIWEIASSKAGVRFQHRTEPQRKK